MLPAVLLILAALPFGLVALRLGLVTLLPLAALPGRLRALILILLPFRVALLARLLLVDRHADLLYTTPRSVLTVSFREHALRTRQGASLVSPVQADRVSAWCAHLCIFHARVKPKIHRTSRLAPALR